MSKWNTSRGIDTLQALWTNRDLSSSLSPAEKHKILKQIAAYVDQLRLLEPPQKGLVASAGLGPCLDGRLYTIVLAPFPTMRTSILFSADKFPWRTVHKCTVHRSRSVILASTGRGFGHADLCPRNIIIRNGDVAAIVDWQFARWYPEYWEYTKARFGLFDMPDWYDGFRNAAARYDHELAAEKALWVQPDQPGMLQ